MDTISLRPLKMVALLTLVFATTFHAQAQLPSFLYKPFVYAQEKILKNAWAYVWTPRIRSALAWTGGGVVTGGLVGLGSAAGEPLGCFSILYRTVLACCAGGCIGYGVHHYRRWSEEVLLKEASIKEKEVILEKIKVEALAQVKNANEAVQSTQKLFEERSRSFDDKIGKLNELLQKYKKDFEVKIGGIDTQVQQGAQKEVVEKLREGVVKFRNKLNVFIEQKNLVPQAIKELQLQALELKTKTETLSDKK